MDFFYHPYNNYVTTTTNYTIDYNQPITATITNAFGGEFRHLDEIVQEYYNGMFLSRSVSYEEEAPESDELPETPELDEFLNKLRRKEG